MQKLLAPLSIALLLSACGQSGALYLPDRGKPPARHEDKPAKVVPLKTAKKPPAPTSDTPAEDQPTQPTPSP